MAHKLKIELADTDPKIYRTVVVPEHFTFHELHQTIQLCMNWEDYHLYQFNVGAPYFSDAISIPSEDDEEYDFKLFDAREIFLSEYLQGNTKKINYLYDFGDSWLHVVRLLAKPKEEVLYPQCIKGEHAAPAEDCGGIYGFYDMLRTLHSESNTKAKREMRTWLGLKKHETYENQYGFDIEKINRNLKEMFGGGMQR